MERALSGYDERVVPEHQIKAPARCCECCECCESADKVKKLCGQSPPALWLAGLYKWFGDSCCIGGVYRWFVLEDPVEAQARQACKLVNRLLPAPAPGHVGVFGVRDVFAALCNDPTRSLEGSRMGTAIAKQYFFSAMELMDWWCRMGRHVNWKQFWLLAGRVSVTVAWVAIGAGNTWVGGLARFTGLAVAHVVVHLYDRWIRAENVKYEAAFFQAATLFNVKDLTAVVAPVSEELRRDGGGTTAGRRQDDGAGPSTAPPVFGAPPQVEARRDGGAGPSSTAPLQAAVDPVAEAEACRLMRDALVKETDPFAAKVARLVLQQLEGGTVAVPKRQ